jgi:hypothetical protein
MATTKGTKIVKAFNPAHLALMNPHRLNPGIIGAVPAKRRKRRNPRKANNPAFIPTLEAALFAILGAAITRFVSATGQQLSPVQITGVGLALAEGLIGFGLGWASEHFNMLNAERSKQLAAGGVGVGITHAADTLIGSMQGAKALNTTPVKEATAVNGIWSDNDGNYYDSYGNMLNDVVTNPFYTEHDFYGTTSALGDIVAVPPGIIEV